MVFVIVCCTINQALYINIIWVGIIFLLQYYYYYNTLDQLVKYVFSLRFLEIKYFEKKIYIGENGFRRK